MCSLDKQLLICLWYVRGTTWYMQLATFQSRMQDMVCKVCGKKGKESSVIPTLRLAILPMFWLLHHNLMSWNILMTLSLVVKISGLGNACSLTLRVEAGTLVYWQICCSGWGSECTVCV